MFDAELDTALDAVRLAATLCQRVQSRITTEHLEKKDKSPVTVADFGSQAIVAKALQETFPQVPLIAEEDSAALRQEGNAELGQKVLEEVRTTLGDGALAEDSVHAWIDHGNAKDYSELFWTLDPIDGTKGFLRGEQYAIALSLVADGVPVASVLGCPNLEGADGAKGAFLIATRDAAWSIDSNGARTPIHVSRADSLAASRFCESVESGHSDHSQSKAIAERLGITKEPVRMDSQAKYASLARGDAEIYLRLPTRKGYVERIWDHAAGYGVLKAAGGRITDINGADLDFRHGAGLEKNRGVIASHGPFHEQILEAVQATMPAGE